MAGRVFWRLRPGRWARESGAFWAWVRWGPSTQGKTHTGPSLPLASVWWIDIWLQFPRQTAYTFSLPCRRTYLCGSLWGVRGQRAKMQAAGSHPGQASVESCFCPPRHPLAHPVCGPGSACLLGVSRSCGEATAGGPRHSPYAVGSHPCGLAQTREGAQSLCQHLCVSQQSRS